MSQFDSSVYVRQIEGSDPTGKGGQKYRFVQVFNPSNKSWGTVRACSDFDDAKRIERDLKACLDAAYADGRAGR